MEVVVVVPVRRCVEVVEVPVAVLGESPVVLASSGPMQQQDDLSVWSALVWLVREDLQESVLRAEERHRSGPAAKTSTDVSVRIRPRSTTVVVVVTTRI